jgi:GNAT superfamily N-acetyltransferase
MTEYEVIKAIDNGAAFYLDFFGSASHMGTTDNGVYREIRPKEGEQGIRFVYGVRLDGLSDVDAKAKVAEIKSLNLPVWWPLYPAASPKARAAIYGSDYRPKLPSGNDEHYMALFPENQPENAPSGIEARRVETADDFKIWAESANKVFAGGYQDIHPANHFRWLENGLLAAYITYHGGNPAAVASILNNNGVASLEFVATLEEYRRRGYAKAASIAAIRNAFADGARIVTLRAFYPASLLYERLGFKAYEC